MTAKRAVGESGHVADHNALGGALFPQRNRTRRVPPAVGAYRLLRPSLLAAGGSGWRSTYFGMGYDVVFDHATGLYTLLVSAQNATRMTLGVYTSPDMLNWTEYGSNPVLAQNPTGGQADSGGVSFPQLHHEDGTWYCFYIGFPNSGFESGQPKVCYATATSLTGPWTRQGIALQASQISWMSSTDAVYRPNVFKVNSTYYMFFNGGTVGSEKIGYATATAITGPWTPAATAVFQPSDFSESGISDPDVFRVGDDFYMLLWGYQGIHLGHTTAANFPAGWTVVSPNVIPKGTNNYSRPLTVFTDDGLRVVTSNGNGAGPPTAINLHTTISATPPRAIATNTRLTGSVSVTSTSWTLVPTPVLLLPAAAGDIIQVSVSLGWDNGAPNAFMDVASYLASSPVNAWSTGAAPSGSTQGLVGGAGQAATFAQKSVTASRRVTSADIDADGIVTLGVIARVETTGTRLIYGSSTTPLRFEAVNLGPGI